MRRPASIATCGARALAKSSLAGGVALQLQTNQAHVADLARNHVNNLGLDFSRRYVAEAEKLTLESVRQAAEKYLTPENYAVAIVRGRGP